MTAEEIKSKILETHIFDDTDGRNRVDWAAIECFNAQKVEILPSGDVWIEKAGVGQVLDDNNLYRLWAYVTDQMQSTEEPEPRCRSCGRIQEDMVVSECDECA